MSEETKPCPFCGDIPKDTWTVTELGTKYPAYQCECFSRRIIAFKWQNAYCWQLLSEKDRRIKELEGIHKMDLIKHERLERVAEKLNESLKESTPNDGWEADRREALAEYREMRGKP